MYLRQLSVAGGVYPLYPQRDVIADLPLHVLRADERGATKHERGKLILIRLLLFHGGNRFTSAHDRNPVADLHNLVELMGDKNDTRSGCLQSADNVEKQLCLLGCQNGRRLVEYHDLCTAVERLHDLHALCFAHRNVLHLFIQTDVKTVIVDIGIQKLRRL